MRIGTNREDCENVKGLAPYAHEPEKGAGPARLSRDEEEELLQELMQLELSETQSRDLLSILVWLMGFFVEHGFDGNICGQIFEGLIHEPAEDSRSAKIAFASATENAETRRTHAEH